MIHEGKKGTVFNWTHYLSFCIRKPINVRFVEIACAYREKMQRIDLQNDTKT